MGVNVGDVVVTGSENLLNNVAAHMAKTNGTEDDWRNDIPVPKPPFYGPRPELVGAMVVPHTCTAKVHGDNFGCICELIGKEVKILGIIENETGFSGLYRPEGSDRRLMEREFSEDTAEDKGRFVSGFIFQNPEGKFLSQALVWIERSEASAGMIHNKQIVKDLIKRNFFDGLEGIIAFPSRSTFKGESFEMGESKPLAEVI